MARPAKLLAEVRCVCLGAATRRHSWLLCSLPGLGSSPRPLGLPLGAHLCFLVMHVFISLAVLEDSMLLHWVKSCVLLYVLTYFQEKC